MLMHFVAVKHSTKALLVVGSLVDKVAKLRYNTYLNNTGTQMLKMYTLQRNNTYLICGKFVTLAVAQKNKSSMFRYKTMLAHATQSIKQAGDTVAVFTL